MGRKILTLVTECQAKPGTVFRIRLTSKCPLCPLFKFCVSKLKEGAKYRVLEVRNQKHVCKAIGEHMYVALVEELPIVVSLNSGKVVEGLITQYTPIECDVRTCKYYDYCVSSLVNKGAKIRIVNIKQKIKCPKGYHLQLVDVELQP